MKIREYNNNNDLDGVVAVVNTLPEWFDEDARKRSIPIDLRFHDVFVAVNDGIVVGFITCFVYEGRLVIGWMGVHRDQQGRGIGKRLLRKVEDFGENNDLREIATYTLGENVDYPPYEATRAFYFRNGFEVYRRSQTDCDGCPEEIKIKKQIAQQNGAPDADKLRR